MSDGWLHELDLDPTSPWLKMGTRALGGRPWLIVDDKAPAELALRAQLMTEHRDAVLAALPGAEAAAAEVFRLVMAEASRAPLGSDASAPRITLTPDSAEASLSQAGRMVQEDLLLMHWRDDAWQLDAACLCFPSRWRLADKIGRPMLDIHGPVTGYPNAISDKVNTMMGRLGVRPVWRRNWYIHPDPALFQPVKGPDDVVPAERCLEDLYVRSERQTLRRLDTEGWILFTIRIQHCPLGELVGERHDDVVRFLAEAPSESITHHGIKPEQLVTLGERLGLV